MAGKGDKPRPANGRKYRCNYHLIFRRGQVPESPEGTSQNQDQYHRFQKACDDLIDIADVLKAPEREIGGIVMKMLKVYVLEHGKSPRVLRITEDFAQKMWAAQLPPAGTIMGLQIERDADKLEVVG